MSQVSTVVMFLRLPVAICIDYPYTKLRLGILCAIFAYFVHLYRGIFIRDLLFLAFYRTQIKKLHVNFVAKNVKPKALKGHKTEKHSQIQN